MKRMQPIRYFFELCVSIYCSCGLIYVCQGKKKTGHISFKCQLYSVWRTIKMRGIKNTHTQAEMVLWSQTNTHKAAKTNGLYEIRYSHELNKWFIAFRFNSFPYFFFARSIFVTITLTIRIYFVWFSSYPRTYTQPLSQRMAHLIYN